MSDFFEAEVDDLENIETEDDFETERAQFRDLALSASDWTVETLYGQIQKGNVDLNPSFQRRDVWDVKKKSAFIESLMLGIPVPQIVIAQKKNERGKYIVLDGKQRLLSIRDFYDGRYALSGLSVLKELQGFHCDRLPEGWKDSLDNSTVRAVRITGWCRDSVLYTVFHRLNTGSVSLSLQELRSALFPGAFTQFAAEFTNVDYIFAKLLNKKDEPDFRMRDVELLTRYSGLVNYPELFGGSLKSFLDETTIKLNELRSNAVYSSLAENARATIEAYRELYREMEQVYELRIPVFSLVQEGKKPRFNRAVFDALCFSAKSEAVRKAMCENQAEVADGLISLFADPRFIEACTLTTKTRESLVTRVDLWSSKLCKVIGRPVSSLRLDNEGIIREYKSL